MGHNLLVIGESDPALNEVLVSTLAREGFKVATYPDYREALSALGRLKPDLIVLGERPSVDSFKACSQLRRLVDIPIMILGTARGDTAWAKATAAGGDFYLVKPFYHSELVARVKAILRRYQWSLEEINGSG